MEALVIRLSSSDNQVIKEATAELQIALKNIDSINQFCELTVSTTTDVAVRQYAALILRQHFVKLRTWQTIPEPQRELIKNGMLNALQMERESTVRNHIALFVAVLIKHEFTKQDQWTLNVLKYINDGCCSADPKIAADVSSVFNTITEMAPDQFMVHFNGISEIFNSAFIAFASSNEAAMPFLHIVQVMGNLVPFSVNNQLAEQTYQKSIPYILKGLSAFATTQPPNFVLGFDILDTMAEYNPKLLMGHVKLLLEYCLEAAHNDKLDGSVRVSCITYIGVLVRIMKKSIIKQKLVLPIIQVVFRLIASDEMDELMDNDDVYYLEDDEPTPKAAALQTMDLIATNLPPEKFIPPLLTLLEPALKSPNPSHQRGAFCCIAVIAEGCSEAICNKYLRPLWDCIKSGIIHENHYVRSAAFFALGQFAEFLQPEITKYSDEILPILFQFLQDLTNDIKKNADEEPKHVDRMFYALETFCENLEDIDPYLPTLMERLFEVLDAKNKVHLRELGLSCVASTVSSAKLKMLPYFSRLIDIIKMYLVKSDDEDICELRPIAIDALASLARSIGTEHFAPFTNDAMQFALHLMEDTDDSILRVSIYNLLASLAEVLHGEMAPVLPKIVERLINSILCNDDIITDYNDGRDDIANVFEAIKQEKESNGNDEIDIEHSINDDDDDDDDDDDEDDPGFSVRNGQLEEKEEAILALKQIAEFTGTSFIPYIESSFETVFKQIDHPQDDIRKVAMSALAQFLVTLNEVNTDKKNLLNALDILIPKIGTIIKTDEDCQVVIAAIETYAQILSNLKDSGVRLPDKMKEIIFESIQLILTRKIACKFNEYNDCGGGDADDDGDDDSEYDEVLNEIACDVIPKFGNVLEPLEFAGYFARLLPYLINKIEKSLNNEDLVSQRSSAIGSLSECFEGLKEGTGHWFNQLLPYYLNGLQDINENVRHNSVYGLGELVFYSGEHANPKYTEILMAISMAVSIEQHAGTLDNICGALARIIVANHKLVPLDQVLPVFMEKLPLREDFDENTAVFKAFDVLFNLGVEALLPILDKLIFMGLYVLYKKEYKNDDTQKLITNLLQNIRIRFTDRFNAVVSSDPEIANFVQTL